MKFPSWILYSVLLCLFTLRAWAYPEFIGYGYATCITCHYNSHGSGALTDYGRGVWASEIAAKWLTPRTSDEALSESSGFLGSVELPIWFKPSIKYRGLNLINRYRSGNEDHKYILMQSDYGFATQFSDKASSPLLVFTAGHVPDTRDLGVHKANLYAKEYYVRLNFAKTWWAYGGLIEKVYGIRNVDHTSFQRTFQDFNPYPNRGLNHSLGVVVHRIEKTWEAAINGFGGNPNENLDYQKRGGSVQAEFDVGVLKRLGASILTSASDREAKDMAAIHYRQGFQGGSAFIAEIGLIKQQDKVVVDAAEKNGGYQLFQGLIKLTRGLFWKTTFEQYNSEYGDLAADNHRYSTGLLMFPMQRVEFRFDLASGRTLVDTSAAHDTWIFAGQVHGSF
ncbi:MAG: hypothetical protein V4736_15730 [Bdellovibrionota bacterium]